MEKFLEKIQLEIENKMIACIKGESIVKPFSQIYQVVREKIMNEQKSDKKVEYRSTIYSDGESSIYAAVVKQFLQEHPELREKKNKDKEEDK